MSVTAMEEARENTEKATQGHGREGVREVWSRS